MSRVLPVLVTLRIMVRTLYATWGFRQDTTAIGLVCTRPKTVPICIRPWVTSPKADQPLCYQIYQIMLESIDCLCGHIVVFVQRLASIVFSLSKSRLCLDNLFQYMIVDSVPIVVPIVYVLLESSATSLKSSSTSTSPAEKTWGRIMWSLISLIIFLTIHDLEQCQLELELLGGTWWQQVDSGWHAQRHV